MQTWLFHEVRMVTLRWWFILLILIQSLLTSSFSHKPRFSHFIVIIKTYDKKIIKSLLCWKIGTKIKKITFNHEGKGTYHHHLVLVFYLYHWWVMPVHSTNHFNHSQLNRQINCLGTWHYLRLFSLISDSFLDCFSGVLLFSEFTF